MTANDIGHNWGHWPDIWDIGQIDIKNIRQILGIFGRDWGHQADIGQTLGRHWADIGQTLGRHLMILSKIRISDFLIQDKTF